jgi:hypothetical protein
MTTTSTPTPSDFKELLAERGVAPERAEQLVAILYGEAPRLLKFGLLAGALGFPPEQASALARELDEVRLISEVRELRERVAKLTAGQEHAEIIGQLLAAHSEVWDLEQELLQIASAKPAEVAEVMKSGEGRRTWGKLGSARNRLNAVTKRWVDAGRPGAR